MRSGLSNRTLRDPLRRRDGVHSCLVILEIQDVSLTEQSVTSIVAAADPQLYLNCKPNLAKRVIVARRFHAPASRTFSGHSSESSQF